MDKKTSRKIDEIEWEDRNNRVIYKLQGMGWYSTEELQPYTEQKEESMEETTQLVPVLDKDTNEILYYTDKKTGINYAPMGETTLHLIDGYDLVDENGNVINAKKITLTKKQPQYPKIYKECLKAFGYMTDMTNCKGYKCELLESFQKLLICRDAYWKIAGDWKPEFRFGKKKYCIMTEDNRVINDTVEETNRILVFPAEEMRDVFYENFKELIESCKELL